MIRPGAKFRNPQLGTVCVLTLSCALLAAASPRQDAAASSSDKSTTAQKTSSATSHKQPSSSSSGVKKSSGKTTGKHTSRRKTSRAHGQQKIDGQRATAIQEALIREHYLTGEPTGTWNDSSEEAMRRYQADHGWQSKTVPDSRALISLGLGPSKDHLLNPESAMTTVPDPPPTSHTSPATAAPVAPSGAAPAASTPPPAETTSPQ